MDRCSYKLVRTRLRLQLGGWMGGKSPHLLALCGGRPCATYVTLRCWLSDRNLAGVDMEFLLHSAQRHGLHKAPGAE